MFLLLVGAVVCQYRFDAARATADSPAFSLPPSFVRALDAGLHSAAASLLWISTRTELPFLEEGADKFRNDFNLVVSLDPKFSAPYVFTMLVLPETEYPDPIASAIELGERGLAAAVPLDWRIPFHLGTLHHLYKKDRAAAASYFDIAARTPGIPEIVERFAVNYGIMPGARAQTEAIWRTILETAKDEETRARAELYVEHFRRLGVLQTASDRYRDQFGVVPSSLDDLSRARLVGEIPASPFGFEFYMYEEGIVGIKPLEAR